MKARTQIAPDEMAFTKVFYFMTEGYANNTMDPRLQPGIGGNGDRIISCLGYGTFMLIASACC